MYESFHYRERSHGTSMRPPVRDCILSFMIPDAGPQLATDPELAPILAELSSREPIFHRPEFGTTRADFERMMADDFWEVGASGASYPPKIRARRTRTSL